MREPLSHQKDILIHSFQLFESMTGIQLYMCNLCHQLCEGLLMIHEWSHEDKGRLELVEDSKTLTLLTHKLLLLNELVEYYTVGHHKEDFAEVVISLPPQNTESSLLSSSVGTDSD